MINQVEVYDAANLNCYAFKRSTDSIDGHLLALGNMVSGFPFNIEDVTFLNSECAYIAGMFSNDILDHYKIQKALQIERNGFIAKKTIKHFNESKKRTDWETFNVQWMFYCVWCKTVNNSDFRNILLDIPLDAVIIEDTTFQNGATAAIWGAKNPIQKRLAIDLKKELRNNGYSQAAINKVCDEKRLGIWRNQGMFIGKNLMGKILMHCRDAVVYDKPPNINLNLLHNKQIYLFGKLLTFDNIPTLKIK